MASNSNNIPELALIEAIRSRDRKGVSRIIDENPGINMNYVDKDGFGPLQKACHLGDLELVKILLDKGGDVNFTTNKTRYSPLMLAAINDEIEIVNYLLEKGADKKLHSNKKTASDLASLRGLAYIATVINCYIPYAETIKPYINCQNDENEPKLRSEGLAIKLHQWLLLPTLHPIKILYYVMENPELIKNTDSCIYVVRKLSFGYQKPDPYDDALSIKFHYMAELLRNCKLLYDQTDKPKGGDEFDEEYLKTFLMKYLRRLNSSQLMAENSQMSILNDLVRKCILSYPYKTETFESINFAMSILIKNDVDSLFILSQAINYLGQNYLGHCAEDCQVCKEGTNNEYSKKIRNKRCAACRKVYYCGPICQKVDWLRHKRECKTRVH